MPPLAYYFIRFVVKLFALLPFSVLYILSDILYLVLYKMLRYRQKVVRNNLYKSFPSYNREQILRIEIDFYHHFCDIIVETIKMAHVSEKEMKKRFVVTNPSLLDDFFVNKNSCIGMLGHYGNWEWSAALPLSFNQTENVTFLYKQLKNKSFDSIMFYLRSVFGVQCVEKDLALRTIAKNKKNGISSLIGFIADQTPSARNIRYWTNFLHQDTPVFDGGERIARGLALGMVYIDVKKVKRGFYELTLVLMSDNVAKTKEFEMTELYVNLLETTINRQPAHYLWTHRRWKHKRNNHIEPQKQ